MGIFDRKNNSSTPQGPARTVNLVKDPSGAPAVNLEKVRSAGHVDLVKRAEKAGVSLSKRDLAGFRGQVRAYLDHSQSMEFPGARDYTNGNVQTLSERSLGFTLQIDVDGIIPTSAFDSRLWKPINVTVDNYRGVVNREIWKPNQMGGTSFAAPLEDLLHEAKSTNEPIIGLIVTDGDPQDRARATQLVCELSHYPVFLKFLAIRPVGYLEYLDDLEDHEPGRRLLDNVDTKFIGDPAGMSDLAFADAMADELDSWIAAATRAGVLR